MTNVQPINDYSLDQLKDEWQALKNAETRACNARIDIENQILAHPDISPALKDEGTTNVDNLKISTGYTRIFDQDKLAAMVEEGIPAKLFPFSVQYKENRADAKYVESNEPETWAYISQHLNKRLRRNGRP